MGLTGSGGVLIGWIERIVRVELVNRIGRVVGVKPINWIEGVSRIKSVGWVEWIIWAELVGRVEDVVVAFVLRIKSRLPLCGYRNSQHSYNLQCNR